MVVIFHRGSYIRKLFLIVALLHTLVL